MRLLSKTVLALAISFTAVKASADTLISCASKDNANTWKYVISGSDSKRLGSGILATVGGNPVVIQAQRVAQYAATNALLYMLTDDVSNTSIYRFTAAFPNQPSFPALLEVLGSQTISHSMKCTSTQQ